MTRGLQTVFAGAIALGLAHPLLPQMQKLPQMHTGGGTIIVPESSIARPEDVGKRARTFVRIFIPDAGLPINAANTPGGFFETPASLACVYQLVTAAKTCNPSTATTVSHGGAHAIALVDAYDDPNAASDLAVFSTEFGLPAANFQVVYAAPGSSTATNTPPPQDSSGGWEFEESVDIQMAHAMAPHAKIFLVEANSSGSGDLLPAVTLASNLVSAAGGGEVSMSWGFGDFAGENGFDGYFTTTGVVYFSSSGDSAGISYPCTSPDVVCVGGTTISRNATTGNFEYESAWPDTGGGPSPNEPIPSYQSGIASIVGTQRGTPDLAFVADGRTPVWVYDTFPISGTSGTWWLASGTSVSAPGMAGIVNTAGHFYTSTNAELSEVYSQIGVTTEFKDIVSGNCGAYAGYLAKKGWDFCSGVGVNVGKTGK
jgi:subtilase family serine protease